MKQTKPNFLIFCTDQQRADHIGCANNPILKTPNIDKIAQEGVRFSSCYTSSPACMPARATMFTGLTTRASNMRSNGIPLPRSIATLPQELSNAGYRTHSVGKLHLNTWGGLDGNDLDIIESVEDNPERLIHWARGNITKSPDNYYGFQTQDSVLGHVDYVAGDYKTWLDENHPGAYEKYKNANPETLTIEPELHYNNWIADRTIDFLQENSQTNDPFFVWCSFPDPHFPFCRGKKMG